LTGKNVAKKGLIEKNKDKKQYTEDMKTFRQEGEYYIIQICIKQMNNYSEQCARRKENELEKS
jgi:predicted rRNA methylase YqxC with S4 and FtsJ domains